jgi:hypothetical protein
LICVKSRICCAIFPEELLALNLRWVATPIDFVVGLHRLLFKPGFTAEQPL